MGYFHLIFHVKQKRKKKKINLPSRRLKWTAAPQILYFKWDITWGTKVKIPSIDLLNKVVKKKSSARAKLWCFRKARSLHTQKNKRFFFFFWGGGGREVDILCKINDFFRCEDNIKKYGSNSEVETIMGHFPDDYERKTHNWKYDLFGRKMFKQKSLHFV